MIVLKVDMLVKPGMEAQCREYIKILQEHSRKEPGCLMYVGHQSTEDPANFFSTSSIRMRPRWKPIGMLRTSSSS